MALLRGYNHRLYIIQEKKGEYKSYVYKCYVLNKAAELEPFYIFTPQYRNKSLK